MTVTEPTTGSEVLARRQGSAIAPRRRVRVPFLMAGVGLVLLAALLVLWGWSRAADRAEVMMVTQPVAAGTPIPASALSSTLVGVDDGIGRFYPVGTDLSGVVAATDLAPGDLLTPSLVSAAPAVPGDWREVGALVAAGWYPATVERGDQLQAVPVTGEPTEGAEIEVAVVIAQIADDESLSAVLAVPPADAARVAQWSANHDLALVRLP